MNRFAIRCAAGLSVLFLLAACSSVPSSGDAAGAGSGSSEQQMTITVGDRPTSSDPANRAQYDQKVADFQKANPDIKLNPVETLWDPTTFQAQAAGGQLPDVLNVPFTEPQGLIARKQVADLTKVLKDDGLMTQLNPNVLKIGQDQSGNVYAVPTAAYSVGLVYNRDLFTKAGLDPNKPPATWDELRAYAKQITQKTGQAGYAQMTTSNTGGWMFTTQSYAFGGSIENEDGSKASFDDAPSRAALQALHDMKWVDKSMGQAVLYDIDGISKAFAAGKIGMYMSAPDAYRTLVTTNGLKASAFGIGPMPQQGGDHGTLSGGSVQIVSPNATDAEKAAAIKWIKFAYLNKYVNQDAAVTAAKNGVAAKQPVGVPGLPVVAADQYSTYQDWIKPYVNVPLENFAPYTKVAADQKIIPEPPVKAQEVYAALDPVVQTVLGNEKADIPALLTKAAGTVNAKLGR
ncbi:extracellular solute-binding protein [Kribbella solani]|uniref:extracellular solute-binding protein n=1 Tax=Kribbella solani TaxID=236067 RepID=UPI0029AAE725|nr:extracellular solute-binding protein [Kribbella solani]MDX2973759.1 extracellular solute-binding protein [Kribbella solani]